MVQKRWFYVDHGKNFFWFINDDRVDEEDDHFQCNISISAVFWKMIT